MRVTLFLNVSPRDDPEHSWCILCNIFIRAQLQQKSRSSAEEMEQVSTKKKT